MNSAWHLVHKVLDIYVCAEKQQKDSILTVPVLWPSGEINAQRATYLKSEVKRTREKRFLSLYHGPGKHGEDLQHRKPRSLTVKSERLNRDSKPTPEINTQRTRKKLTPKMSPQDKRGSPFLRVYYMPSQVAYALALIRSSLTY